MRPVFFAILAAVLYALNSPLSKLLLQDVPPAMMASFLYLGAGFGLFVMGMIRKIGGTAVQEQLLTRAASAGALKITVPVCCPVKARRRS